MTTVRIASWVRGHVARWWREAAVAAVVAVASWPRVQPLVVPDLDISWRVALQLAVPTRTAWGPDLLFTHGPLGFAFYPQMFAPGPGTLALLVFAAMWLLFASLVVVVLARALPLWAAGALALVVLVLASRVAPTTPNAVIDMFVLLLLTDLLVRGASRWSWPAAVGAGLFAAVAMLSKVDSGVAVIAMVGIAFVAGGAMRRGRRGGVENGIAVLGGFLVGIPALWLVSRQTFADLGDWIAGTAQVVRGYSAAMGAEERRFEWEYGAALLVVVALLALAWTAVPPRRSARLAVGLVLAAGLYPLFRSGFTRHPARGSVFFVAIAVVACAFVTAWSRRDFLLFLLVSVITVIAAAQLTIADLVDVDTRAASFGNNVELVVSSGRRHEWIEQQRAAFARSYAVPERMLAEIGGGSVHVVPWETGVVFTYPELQWSPLPVFQDYSAYTEYLDDRNSDRLRAADRPRFVLRQPSLALDGRLPRFEPPRQNLELLCRYRRVDRSRAWQLLAAGRNRCGSIEPGAIRSIRLGERVRVPTRPNDVVVARFAGIGTSFEDRIETTLLRGPAFFINDGRTDHTWRFLAGTQGSWHVLTAPSCAASELEGTGPPLPRFALSDHDGPATGDESYTVQFAHLRYRCRTTAL